MVHASIVHTVDKLIEDEEELVGAYAADGQVVVAILRIVEVKTAQFSFHQQEGDDLLDVGIGR